MEIIKKLRSMLVWLLISSFIVVAFPVDVFAVSYTSFQSATIDLINKKIMVIVNEKMKGYSVTNSNAGFSVTVDSLSNLVTGVNITEGSYVIELTLKDPIISGRRVMISFIPNASITSSQNSKDLAKFDNKDLNNYIRGTKFTDTTADLSWIAYTNATGISVQKSPNGTTGWTSIKTFTQTESQAFVSYTVTGLSLDTDCYLKFTISGGDYAGTSNIIALKYTQYVSDVYFTFYGNANIPITKSSGGFDSFTNTYTLNLTTLNMQCKLTNIDFSANLRPLSEIIIPGMKNEFFATPQTPGTNGFNYSVYIPGSFRRTQPDTSNSGVDLYGNLSLKKQYTGLNSSYGNGSEVKTIFVQFKISDVQKSSNVNVYFSN